MKLKHLLLKSINFYQKHLSPRKFLSRNSTCVFIPSCSEYAKEAINKYGILKGIYLSIFRIFRCHPWQKNHYDPLK